MRVGGSTIELLPNTLTVLNRLELKKECELVIADFHSADWPLEEWVHERLPGVQVNILNLPDRYFSRGKGLNAAARGAQGHILLFTDADVALSDDFLHDCLHLPEDSALFPVCLDVADPYRRTGEYGYGNYGICAMSVGAFRAVGPWPDWRSWGGDGEYLHARAQRHLKIIRKTYDNLIHQWHPKYLGHYEYMPNHDFGIYTGKRPERSDYSGFLYTVDVRAPAKGQIETFHQLYSGVRYVDVAIEETPFVIRCRPQTTDLQVVFDTFQGLYHLPPAQLPGDAAILDLGANIGCTMLHFASIFPNARIVGVELDHDNFQLAKKNMRAFWDRCSLVHAAVWKEDGEVEYGGTEAWGLHVEPGGSKRVPAKTIQSLMSENSMEKIDYLKMDVEGAEHAIMNGNTDWLLKTNSIKIEVHNDDQMIPQFIDMLKNAGFRAWKDTHHWSCVVGLRE